MQEKPTSTSDIKLALDEVSASSAGGAPFLIAYGATFLITALLSFFLPRSTTAMIAIFQGAVALPAAFWLERRMGTRRMAAENPMRSLSGLVAGSQALGLPALIVTYSPNPGAIPVMLASLGGVHFLPYAWLHRTRVYIYLGQRFRLAHSSFRFCWDRWLFRRFCFTWRCSIGSPLRWYTGMQPGWSK